MYLRPTKPNVPFYFEREKFNVLGCADHLWYLQANFRRIKRRGVQTMSKDLMPETFLQRLVEKAIRHLL
jgi:hypothetical protein